MPDAGRRFDEAPAGFLGLGSQDPAQPVPCDADGGGQFEIGDSVRFAFPLQEGFGDSLIHRENCTPTGTVCRVAEWIRTNDRPGVG